MKPKDVEQERPNRTPSLGKLIADAVAKNARGIDRRVEIASLSKQFTSEISHVGRGERFGIYVNRFGRLAMPQIPVGQVNAEEDRLVGVCQYSDDIYNPGNLLSVLGEHEPMLMIFTNGQEANIVIRSHGSRILEGDRIRQQRIMWESELREELRTREVLANRLAERGLSLDIDIPSIGREVMGGIARLQVISNLRISFPDPVARDDESINLYALEREIEQRYPEFVGGEDYAPEESNYIFFNPSYYLSHGLIPQSYIEALGKDKSLRVLSVGAGPAYLERYLIEKLGLGSDQIFLSDKDANSVIQLQQQGYNAFTFDMQERWPIDQLSPSFDLIIFPESISVPNDYPEEISPAEEMEALRRIVGTSFDMSLFEGRDNNQTSKGLDAFCNIINNALKVLSSDGEIRIKSPIQEEIIYAAQRRFSDEGVGLNFHYNTDSHLLIIRRVMP